MRAAIIRSAGTPPELIERPVPSPAAGQLLIKVHACGVCRTDLHIADGDLPLLRSPVVPGHEIVGRVHGVGAGVTGFAQGMRVGVPWLGWCCGNCKYCRRGEENLCDDARFTGYHMDGGYADYAIADARYCFALPAAYSDANAAPLLCAGLIGYRALCMAGDAPRLGLYGFGAAAHILAQVAVWQGRALYAFCRAGDTVAAAFARSLGACWAGDSTSTPDVQLDAAIIFAPVGELVPAALRAVGKGGTVVCAGIHMSDIPSFPYSILWGERQIKSVANLTRRDARAFLALAPEVPVRTEVTTFALEEVAIAMSRLRDGQINGAAVLVMQ